MALLSRSILTAPRDGRRALWYLDFGDGDVPGWVIGHWVEDARGFCIVDPDSLGGGGWHKRGARAWRPLPRVPGKRLKPLP